MNEESAIALLLAQNAMEQESIPPPPVVTVTMSPNPSPKVKAKRDQPIHKPLTAAVVGTIGIEKGSLDAAGFLMAVRKAGQRRTPEGRPFHDQREVRGDVIKAIQAFVGYDPRGDFGQQETAARAKAQALLNPARVTAGQTRQEARAATQSLRGFVAGMPEVQKSKLEELQAREAYTVGEILDLQKVIDALPKNSVTAIAKGVEMNRLQCLLSNVRESLRQFGG